LIGEPVFEDIETCCPVVRRQVVLTLQCERRSRADVVSGVPLSCSCFVGCRQGIKCLLFVERISSTRRKSR